MSKITLNNIGVGTPFQTAIATINANNDAIEAEWENNLSRDGETPNTMQSNLDMNSNRILNLPAPSSIGEPLRLGDVENPIDITYTGFINLKDFGAVGDGITDDTSAINAWLNSLQTGEIGFAPSGNYLFTTPLVKSNVEKFGIYGAGRWETNFIYGGLDTTVDLFTIGDETSERTGVVLKDFRIDSNVLMTSGNALRLKRLTRSEVRNVVAGGQDGNNKTYDGVYFDRVDFLAYDGFDIKTTHDGIKIRGGDSSVPRADLFISNGKIGQCGRYGVVVGGGFGGLYIDATDVIACGSHGIVLDQSLVAVGNREIFIGAGCFLDSNGGSGIYFNGGFAAGGYASLVGVWSASNADHGVEITSNEVGSRIQITGGTLFQNQKDGIRINSTSPIVVITNSLIRNNLNWGMNNLSAGSNVRAGMNVYSSNTSGTATGVNNFVADSGNFAIGTTGGSDRALTINSPAQSAVACYGIRATQQIQSSVTSEYNGFATAPNTAATSFTLTDLHHHRAGQGTIGAGSSVTNQYGFTADGNLTGATNNYGFRSNINSATNRWNFYSAGTAQNYFNGSVGVGKTVPDYKLQVIGSFGVAPGTSVTPVNNGDIVLEFTNNTTLTFRGKGTDGTVRSGTVTLT